MNLNAAEIRPVTDLCLSSADSSFVFGPAEGAVWHFDPPACGRIVCNADPKLNSMLEATMRTSHPTVHITMDCEGQMFHGSAVLRSLEPCIELDIVDSLVPA